jgi:hypothetical protein
MLFSVHIIDRNVYFWQAINNPEAEHRDDGMDQYGMDENYNRLLDASTNFSYIEFGRTLG